MINEFDQVIIKKSGITGTVVDVRTSKGERIYTIEADKKGTPGGFGDEDSWKLYDCTAAEIEKA